jgi:hypothetical protein
MKEGRQHAYVATDAPCNLFWHQCNTGESQTRNLISVKQSIFTPCSKSVQLQYFLNIKFVCWEETQHWSIFEWAQDYSVLVFFGGPPVQVTEVTARCLERIALMVLILVNLCSFDVRKITNWQAFYGEHCCVCWRLNNRIALIPRFWHKFNFVKSMEFHLPSLLVKRKSI